MSAAYQQSRTERGWDEIRRKCYKRDKHTCQLCNATDKEICAHHIIPWRISQNDKLSNLITLCHKCHAKAEALFNKTHKVLISLYKPDQEKIFEILSGKVYIGGGITESLTVPVETLKRFAKLIAEGLK